MPDAAGFRVKKATQRISMRFSVDHLSLTCRVLGFALYLWGMGALLGPAGRAEITVSRPGEVLSLKGPDYIVSQDLGTTRGENLFHGFLEFNVNTEESVTFTGQDITNIVSLITGGHTSHINGTIRSAVPGANLFLVNPHGVVFGRTAQLNVSGSFHVSTADGVRFADGTIFTGDLGDEGSLTVAPPVAFGFLRDSPSSANPIVIEGSNLRVLPGETLSVVGGDITIVGGSLLAPGGNLNLIGVGTASQGDVPLDTSQRSMDLTETLEAFGEPLGTLEISNRAGLSTSGNSGGRIVIRGRQLTVDQSEISSLNTGRSNSPGVGIDIDVTGTLLLTHGASVLSAATGEGSGGDIVVMANEARIAEGASIATSGSSSGRAGDVQLHAETAVTIQDTADDELVAGIFSFASFASQAGVVRITGDRLVMHGGAIGTVPSADTARREPRSGSVKVDVNSLMLTGGAQIDSSTSSNFDSGTVTIIADAATLSEGSVITVETNGVGAAGDITIEVGMLMLQSGAEITSESRGLGDAGTIWIMTDELRLTDSTVTTNAKQANGGNIKISAGASLLNHSSITATVNEEQGAGGNIAVNSELMLLDHSEIIARASAGMGGNIDIVATGFVADAVSVIDASSDEGINGTVNIESIIDLSESATQLPQSFAEPLTLFEEPCAERLRGGRVSSFVMSGRAGIPPEPSGGLSASMVDMPLEQRDTTGFAHLGRWPEARLARDWRQVSQMYDCNTKRPKTAVSQRTP
jgi:filamentous hemagglutinin family protein